MELNEKINMTILMACVFFVFLGLVCSVLGKKAAEAVFLKVAGFSFVAFVAHAFVIVLIKVWSQQ